MHSLSDYDYHLPKELIAQESIHPHDQSRLLVFEKYPHASLIHSQFTHLADHLPDNAQLIFNNTKVIKARIPLTNFSITKKSGETKQVETGEILIYDIPSLTHNEWDKNIFCSVVSDDKHYRPGTVIHITHNNQAITIHSIKQITDWLVMKIEWIDLLQFLEHHAQMPLPPYIDYDQSKETDYQTIFEQHTGSVATPTASLHFTTELMHKLKQSEKNISDHYVTLHVWLGTFRPVYAAHINDHVIHNEYSTIDITMFTTIANAKINNNPIITVWSTSTRLTESLPYLRIALTKDQPEPLEELQKETQQFRNSLTEKLSVNQQKDRNNNCISHLTIYQSKTWTTIQFATQLYIRPWFVPQIITWLITNFHLPKSSLLIMVAALIGYENMKRIYDEAIKQQYRFYSFGDGSLLML